jgi:hypothetical protein
MGSDGDFLDEEDQTFPSGGVGKRDYQIFNEYLNKTITASYSGTSKILGREGYRYSVNIVKEEIHGMEILDSFLPEEGGEGSDDNDDFSRFLSESTMRLFYTDRSQYILDPGTSIPLDIDIDIRIDMKLPDTTILTVREEDVRYTEEDIWIESETIPGTKDKVSVVTEIRTIGRIEEKDENTALYDRYTTYYDKETGERISSGEYDEKETFAVDRSTYRYKTGYVGTQRSGFFEFPIGRVERKTYPMWDEFSSTEGQAEYAGMDERGDLDVKVFRMLSEDVEVDSGNAILPIYPHPTTTYLLDTVQEWYLDERTGFMVDFYIHGTVKVASSGPFGVIETEVTEFEVFLPENTTSMLREIADLFHNLVIPLSNKEVKAFGLHISFTDDISRQFIDLADNVGTILDILEFWIPLGIIIIGAGMTIVPIFIFIIRKRTRKKDTNGAVVALEMN